MANMSWCFDPATSQSDWVAGEGILIPTVEGDCDRRVVFLPTFALGTPAFYAAQERFVRKCDVEKVLYVPAFDPPLDTADEAKCQELLSIQRGRAQRETPSLVQRRDTLLESMSFATTFSLTSAVKERMPVLYARVIKRAAEKDLDPAQPILRTMTKVEGEEADDGVEVETCRDDESTALLAETALLFTEIMVLIAAPGSSLLVVAPALCVQVAVDFFDIGGYSVFTEPFTH